MGRRPLYRQQRGFTFIELTIVVLILGILAAAGAPRYLDALTSYRLDAAARRMAADLRLARQNACKTSQPRTVSFDVTTDQYTLQGLPGLDRPENSFVVNLNVADYAADLTSADFGGGASVAFDIYGRPAQTGTAVIRNGAKQRTIEVNAAGDVRIY